jgi:hypothetical protein
MSDSEAWLELCDLYCYEQDFSKAAFCMEELILVNPHNHLFHQRYAEVLATSYKLINILIFVTTISAVVYLLCVIGYCVIVIVVIADSLCSRRPRELGVGPTILCTNH